MKKFLFLVSVLVFLAAANMAWATPFNEYYKGYQEVDEGGSYNFYFDIVDKNAKTTNSSLSLEEDEAVGQEVLPLDSAYVYLSLYSVDCAWEYVEVDFTVSYDDQVVEVYDNWFSPTIFTGYTAVFGANLGNTSFLDYPMGELTITASLTCFLNNNDFAITSVGVKGQAGTAPVPEPATLFLLGSGLVGLAGFGRKKMLHKKS